MGKKKAYMRSMVGLHLVAGDLRRKEMFIACNDLRLLLKPCLHEFAGKEKDTHAWHGRIESCKFIVLSLWSF